MSSFFLRLQHPTACSCLPLDKRLANFQLQVLALRMHPWHHQIARRLLAHRPKELFFAKHLHCIGQRRLAGHHSPHVLMQLLAKCAQEPGQTSPHHVFCHGLQVSGPEFALGERHHVPIWAFLGLRLLYHGWLQTWDHSSVDCAHDCCCCLLPDDAPNFASRGCLGHPTIHVHSAEGGTLAEEGDRVDDLVQNDCLLDGRLA
eukprot:CAMPEP_0197712016 /NCGR_PEP_ID=MMETSP1338-20131121/129746_1 /TAXON_ID=43686 ORGANISM="Pelagodinium beii, Strain RCC1491" /NCGR_SAMPLE_ID=MMETSP1338 /ASSEMBLY_ACC=CAM_ASM_000754 /LENGTH=201 /DNA_ID=CAMNT_0043295951 /DNA_START=420 /DNA_END=1025 /DNA_ORIENTATION=-